MLLMVQVLLVHEVVLVHDAFLVCAVSPNKVILLRSGMPGPLPTQRVPHELLLGHRRWLPMQRVPHEMLLGHKQWLHWGLELASANTALTREGGGHAWVLLWHTARRGSPTRCSEICTL